MSSTATRRHRPPRARLGTSRPSKVALVLAALGLTVPVSGIALAGSASGATSTTTALAVQEFVPDGANHRIWNAYNDTTSSNGPAGVGDDVAFVDPEDGLMHVFIRTSAGHLAEYVNDAKTVGQVWSTYDLTTLSGGVVTVADAADPVYDPTQHDLHVYVKATDAHLVDFTDDRANGRTWNAYDVSVSAGGGGDVSGRPDAVAGSLMHVFVDSANGDLVEYVNDGVAGHVWNTYDHSLDAGGGSTVSSGPAARMVGGSVHIYVEAASGDLVEYVNDGAGGNVWNAYDVSSGAGGGGPISADPDPVALGPAVHVYVRSSTGDLVEYDNDGQWGRTWNAYDLSNQAGAGASVAGSSSALEVGGAMHVYDRSASNDLVEYVNDGAGGHVWNSYDQTASSHGPTIATDPSAGEWGGLVHVYGGGPAPVPTVTPTSSPYGSGATGFDISWPQCGGAYPPPASVAVVGVNDGSAFTTNPCFASEASWGGGQLTAYLNLNSPQGSNSSQYSSGPAGSCAVGDLNCESYNYGYNTAVSSVQTAASRGYAPRTWWLDVETGNYWTSSTSANAQVVAGAIAAVQGAGDQVAVYSTGYQWSQIVGGYVPGAPAWYPTGMATATPANWCTATSFAGGPTYLVQSAAGAFDGDYSC